MLVHVTILSLWEIAHYWHDCDPRESNTHNLPLKVRDTLLVLSMNFGKKLSLRAEQNKAYLLEILNQAPRFTARHYRQTFNKSIDSKVFGKRFFSNMFVTRSQLGRWCVKHKESQETRSRLPYNWNLLDDAMVAIEKATSTPPPPAVNEPGTKATTKPLTTSAVVSTPKPSKVIRAADLSSSIYLETAEEVETYIAKLKAELLDTIRSGKRARIS